MSKKKQAARPAKPSPNQGLLDRTLRGEASHRVGGDGYRQSGRRRRRHHGGPEVGKLDAIQLVSAARQVEPLDPEQADTTAFGGFLGPNVLIPGERLPTN